MIRIDEEYLLKISNRLRNFKQVNPTAWRFSCCYCGDSSKNQKKTRGNIYFKHHKYLFKCFNCGVSKSIQEFIRDMDPKIYEDYIIDNYKAGSKTKPDLTMFGVK